MTIINAQIEPNVDRISLKTCQALYSSLSGINKISPFSILRVLFKGNLCPVPALIINFLRVAFFVSPPAKSK